MTSGLYESGVAAVMSGNISLTNDTISCMLVDSTAYTANLTSDVSQSDIPDSAQISTVVLTGKTLDGTTFRATDATFESVETGSNVDAVVVYLDTEYSETSLLIAYIDNASEFPITADGADITLVWDTGANGVLKL